MEEPLPQAGRGGEHGAVYGEGSRGAWAEPLPCGPTAYKMNEKKGFPGLSPLFSQLIPGCEDDETQGGKK